MDLRSLELLLFVTSSLAMLSFLLYYGGRTLAAWWRECRHSPEDTDFIDIPVEWGLDVGLWCVCRHCGARMVLTRARLRELDLE